MTQNIQDGKVQAIVSFQQATFGIAASFLPLLP
jgi:hypothetical protein